MVSIHNKKKRGVFILNHYNLDKIEPLLVRCMEYVTLMTNFYKVHADKVPDTLLDLKKDLSESITELKEV
jgi:hypothetical protein